MRTKGNHGHRRGGGMRAPGMGMGMGGGMPAPGGAPSSGGSEIMAPGQLDSIPAPMPSSTAPIPGGAGAGQMSPSDAGGFKRGGRVGKMC